MMFGATEVERTKADVEIIYGLIDRERLDSRNKLQYELEITQESILM